MLGSDPIYNGSVGPMGQWEMLMGKFKSPMDPALLWIPTGHLHEAPLYYRLQVTWLADPPKDDDEVALFQDVFVQRRMVKPYIPTALLAQWEKETGPVLEYYYPHWKSPQYGVDLHANTITKFFGTYWYLFYGDSSGFGSIQFLDQATFASNQTALQISGLFTDYDTGFSNAPSGDNSDGQGNTNTNAASNYGWNIVLLQKVFTLASGQTVGDPVEDPTNPVTSPVDFPQSGSSPGGANVGYILHGSWCLYQTDGITDAGNPIFDPVRASTWTQNRNALGLPPNTMKLTPWQP